VIIEAGFDSVSFACQRCGKCCHHRRPKEFGDLIPIELIEEFWERSNLIYLTKRDIERIGNKTGRKAEHFVDTLYRYDGLVVRVEDEGSKVILDLPVMRSKEDTTCIFYHDGCSVYEERPIACRLFPFRVEESSSPRGDLLLQIGYNPSCPGIGKGVVADKHELVRLVMDQFTQRDESISPVVQKLVKKGKIRKDARVYRTMPGNARLNEPQDVA
jgi:Fe-S-cluster containining protein